MRKYHFIETRTRKIITANTAKGLSIREMLGQKFFLCPNKIHVLSRG